MKARQPQFDFSTTPVHWSVNPEFAQRMNASSIIIPHLERFLNRVMAGQDTYPPLRTFEEVVSLVLNNYVEKVDNGRIMQGALQGLAEGLDADSAWLTPAQAATAGRAAGPPKGTVGVPSTRTSK